MIDTVSLQFSRKKEFDDIIAKLNRKAVKFNIPLIETKIIKEYTKSFKRNNETHYVKYIDIEILQKISININGWTILGVVEKFVKTTIDFGIDKSKINIDNKYSSIVTEFDGKIIPENYRNADFRHCDHCLTDRERNSVYILEKDGIYKQVGSTCICDFTGNISALATAEMLNKKSLLKEFEPEICEKYPTETHVLLKEFLTNIFAIIKTTGYISKKMAKEKGIDSINYIDMLYNRVHENSHANLKKDRETFFSFLNDETHKLANDAIEYYRNKKVSENNFDYNLQELSQSDLIPIYEEKIAAYIAVNYWKLLQDREKNENSNYIGVVGDKFSGKLQFVKESCFLTAYGTTHIYMFKDINQNSINWFASKAQDLSLQEWYNITGTVKDHKEYKGEKQTILTRCKIGEIQ
jgi:hypothetical protein